MKRHLGIGILVIGLAFLGLVLAQDMMDSSQAKPNNNQPMMQQGYDFGHGMMQHGYGFNHGRLNQDYRFGHGMNSRPNQDMMNGMGMMGNQGMGMMGGMGNMGMMQGGMMCGAGMNGMGGMMGGMGMMQLYTATAEPISLEEAEARLEEVAKTYGTDLQVKDIMAFSNNYYAQLVDEQGQGVAEVLVDRYTGFAYPEPGPNMMWNTRTGMMGFAFAGQPRYNETDMKAQAEAFLANYLPEATITAAQGFSGYYTFDFGRDTTEGMLSVNAYSGEVWAHSWHGSYLNGSH